MYTRISVCMHACVLIAKTIKGCMKILGHFLKIIPTLKNESVSEGDYGFLHSVQLDPVNLEQRGGGMGREVASKERRHEIWCWSR